MTIIVIARLDNNILMDCGLYASMIKIIFASGESLPIEFILTFLHCNTKWICIIIQRLLDYETALCDVSNDSNDLIADAINSITYEFSSIVKKSTDIVEQRCTRFGKIIYRLSTRCF